MVQVLLKALRKYRQMITTSDTTSLSYYLILSVVPILTLLIVSLSFFNFDLKIVKDFLLRYFSNDIASLLVSYLTQRSANYFSIFSIGMCLIISSRGIFRLKQVANRLYEIPKEALSFLEIAFMQSLTR